MLAFADNKDTHSELRRGSISNVYDHWNEFSGHITGMGNPRRLRTIPRNVQARLL